MRVEYPGAIYHVMDRGDRREDIFVNDVDRQDLLKTLAEACQKTAWQVHAYCLMRNHFHLVVETPDANLVEGMRWLLSAYTIRLNHRQKLFGHVLRCRQIPTKAAPRVGQQSLIRAQQVRPHWVEMHVIARRLQITATAALDNQRFLERGQTVDCSL
jgi:REP element-mobilizing transposase RayT